MCLAIPGKIIQLKGNKAVVDFGEETTREVDISLVKAKIGDYVMVHAGFAIEIVDEKEAKETIKAFNEIFGAY
ncbi:MAG: HypC/HybG/HupF family hydrogenase formation chaperone [Candidatus Odinarchaeia archaeon]